MQLSVQTLQETLSEMAALGHKMFHVEHFA